jgi:hypothetical protein
MISVEEKLKEIYDGWKNYIFPNPETEKQAKERMAICIQCPKLLLNNICSKCGCFTPAKVRNSKSYCPLKKW